MAGLREVIVNSIEDYCRQTGMGEGVLGLKAVNDHHAVPQIRRGKATLSRLERIHDYMLQTQRAGATKSRA